VHAEYVPARIDAEGAGQPGRDLALAEELRHDRLAG
jgi:hypothetical protein